jgi:tetratricopeptide (TPR) repeat protein
MAIYVFVTKTCRENALTHGLQQELERFVARVEKAQSLELFANFPPPYLVKRKFGGDQGRLIAEHTRIPGADEHTIVCFLAVLIRGSQDYDRGFGINPVEFGRQHFRDLYTQDELFDWLSSRIDKPVPEPPMPSPAEHHFLHAVSGAVTGEEDWIVAETKDWVRKVTKPDVDAHLGPIWEAITRVAGKLRQASQRSGVESAGNTWSVSWRAYPNERLLVLEDVIPAGGSSARSDGAVEEDDNLSREKLLMQCRRAYLDIIVAEQKLWLDIQRDSEGNLALSPEEQEVIDSTRPGRGTAFPLFINGRAGSGKSTVLQYLFADYLMAYLEMLESGQMSDGGNAGAESRWPNSGAVYFTCSKDLLRRACATVGVLLRNGAQYWHKPERTALLDRRHANIENAFCELRGYLLSLVDSKSRPLFDERNYVSYPRYRRLWMERFGRDHAALREQGPALSWHVIRTHVKGATADDILDPDEYTLLEKKQRTVSREVFEHIYQRVWESWYRRKCEGERLWDDQDLARYLLNNDLVKPAFQAIFCDESQDFTSVELQAILRLSVFSHRKLGQHEVERVPFVFAGDPFQTLNPTGFRWETTKASYFKNFVLSLNPWGDPETSLNYNELSHNYRSSKSIVGFSNLIQARRARLFDLKQVKPQKLWSDEDNPLPVFWFAREDVAFWSEFSRQKDLEVIVPSAEGEEVDYVNRDDELKSRVVVKGDTPSNVWSAARAKGLEFPRVVVYGFGSSEDADRLEQFARSGDSEDAAKRLPAEYFFNQLYVAVSRAKHALYVVDSRAAIKRFWAFASSDVLDEVLKSAPGGAERWKALVTQMVEGKIEDLRTGDYHPVQTAESLEQQGMSAESAYTLRQAAVHFRNADNHAAAERCEAFAAQFEGRFRDAARAFLAQKRWDEAVRAFWMDGVEGRRELRRIGQTEAEISRRLEWKVAEALEANAAVAGGWSVLLEEVARHARENQSEWRPEERKSWSDAVVNAVARIAASSKEVMPEQSWQELLHRIDAVAKLGFSSVGSTDRAKIAVRAGQFDEARRLFEAAGAEVGKFDGQPDEFIEAVANSVEFPRNLSALAKLMRSEQIVSSWDAKGQLALRDTDSEKILAAALLKQGRFVDALGLAIRGKLDQTAVEVAARLIESGEERAAKRAILSAVLLLAQKGEWTLVLRLLDSTPGKSGATKLTWTTILGEALDWGLVRVVASSPTIDDSDIGRKLADRLSDAASRIDLNSEPAARLVGAALESTGQINPAIAFYEERLTKAPSDAKTNEFRQWLRQRLLKAKWKRSLTRMKKTPEAARTDQIGIKNELEKWKLGLPDLIAEFPERLNPDKIMSEVLADLWSPVEEPVLEADTPSTASSESPLTERPNVQTTGPEKVSLFGLDIQFNPEKKRLTITCPPGDERVRLLWDNSARCESDVASEETAQSTWYIPSWSFQLSISSRKGAKRAAVLRWPDQKIELRFDTD